MPAWDNPSADNYLRRKLMRAKIGINGFGRIGRLVVRAILERYPADLEVVAVNDLTDSKTNAHLFKYDTNYGIFPGVVEAKGDSLSIDSKEIRVFAQRDPAQVPWADVGADIVVESTGFFTDAEKAGAHLGGSVKKVIISAPASGDLLTLVLGVNDDMYDPAKHHVISNASCTTNCIAPMAKVLNDAFGVRSGFMTTIHAYTNDQRILDFQHSDLRRARAAAMNIIPTTTGAARAVGLVLPELNGKLNGIALRVPTSTVSVTDFVAMLGKKASAEEINAAFKAASEGALKGILEYNDVPLVSIDFKGNPHSCIFDAPFTGVMDDGMVKVLGWYDNEWGYASRAADLASILAKKGL
jgi:glyceraldehyde 3-phosphate dehydrogenase